MESDAADGGARSGALPRMMPLLQVRGLTEDLLAKLAITRKLWRIDAQVLDLRGLQAALLDDLELLVARVHELVGLARVDDRDDRHVAVADDEAHMLIRDLAKRAKPLHSLRPDLDLQHVGEPDPREDLVSGKRRP